MNTLKIKKVCGVLSLTALAVAMIFTAFVLGRDSENSVETSPKTPKTTTTAPTTTPNTENTTSATTTTNTENTTSATTTTAENNATTTTATTQTTITATVSQKPADGKLDIVASASNSWEENGKVCTQIDIFITNNTGSPINTFDVTINLNYQFEIVNSWNADFSPESTNLRVSKTLDYNIENGSQFNAGLIVKADKKINL